ncbi:sec-independent protein translocase protein TatA [Devosia enhydra]|uniref:Sec-independent protein translocase protein TatA n=1 Tax=Devosia enhydra TaxID=665118 RepID=A0A1K2HUX1_9HYPH|nr:twin-arginine translocase TatA/TatE family subunit [Devosia enhydra]SFZ82367.1 sec-independent protein translocase protein TatA [Devosia enhydra]
MHAPGIWGIIVVAVVVLLLFGRGKISGMMGEVASGIKAFQKGLKDEDKVPPAQIDASTTVEARETDKSKDA